MRRKLLASYVIILLVGTLTTGGLSYSFNRNNNLRNLESSLTRYANLITESLLVEDQTGGPRNFFLLTQKYAEQTGVRVTLLDYTGRVLADSNDNSIIFQSQSEKPEIQYAIRQEIRTVQRFDENTNQETMFLALPPFYLSSNRIILRLSTPLDALLSESFVFLRYIGYSIFLGLILAMIVALINVRAIVQPINDLTMAATRVAGGDFTTQINVRTRDELEILANTFNFMALELEKTISTMQQQNAELDSMLSGMTDGAVAFGKSGEVLLINREAYHLFPHLKHDLSGVSVDEVFREGSEIRNIYRDTMATESVIVREFYVEIEGQSRILRIKSSLMRGEKPERTLMGVFLLIQDITEMRKLENMRSDFVSNVSHELRTPLTLIAGFAETLRTKKNLSEEDKITALRVIELETERLKRLINGLLTLSEIENIETHTHWGHILIDQEVRYAEKLVRPLAEKKHLSLTVKTEAPNITVYGSVDWLRQMLMNLIDNAIKYTSDGGYIVISTAIEGDTVRIIISDSGIGIPDEERGHIFERFYRVSKIRGRDTVGTGLGLTIVQDIVSELKGAIAVDSEPGVGSSFTVSFPALAQESVVKR